MKAVEWNGSADDVLELVHQKIGTALIIEHPTRPILWICEKIDGDRTPIGIHVTFHFVGRCGLLKHPDRYHQIEVMFFIQSVYP